MISILQKGNGKKLSQWSDLAQGLGVFEAVEHHITEAKEVHLPGPLAHLGLLPARVDAALAHDVTLLVVDRRVLVRK